MNYQYFIGNIDTADQFYLEQFCEHANIMPVVTQNDTVGLHKCILLKSISLQ